MKEVITNQYRVYTQDIYILCFAGIKVVFEVCRVTYNSVFLVELATKKYKDGIIVDENLSLSKNPFFVKENNNRLKSTFEVFPLADRSIPIEITKDSDIYWEACKYVKEPVVGWYLAEPFPNYLNTYWKEPEIYYENIPEEFECDC